jgi:hypothetical protein
MSRPQHRHPLPGNKAAHRGIGVSNRFASAGGRVTSNLLKSNRCPSATQARMVLATLAAKWAPQRGWSSCRSVLGRNGDQCLIRMSERLPWLSAVSMSLPWPSAHSMCCRQRPSPPPAPTYRLLLCAARRLPNPVEVGIGAGRRARARACACGYPRRHALQACRTSTPLSQVRGPPVRPRTSLTRGAA